MAGDASRPRSYGFTTTQPVEKTKRRTTASRTGSRVVHLPGQDSSIPAVSTIGMRGTHRRQRFLDGRARGERRREVAAIAGGAFEELLRFARAAHLSQEHGVIMEHGNREQGHSGERAG